MWSWVAAFCCTPEWCTNGWRSAWCTEGKLHSWGLHGVQEVLFVDSSRSFTRCFDRQSWFFWQKESVTFLLVAVSTPNLTIETSVSWRIWHFFILFQQIFTETMDGISSLAKRNPQLLTPQEAGRHRGHCTNKATTNLCRRSAMGTNRWVERRCFFAKAQLVTAPKSWKMNGCLENLKLPPPFVGPWPGKQGANGLVLGYIVETNINSFRYVGGHWWSF